MNSDLIEEINNLSIEYKSTKDDNLLERIQRKLILLEYQTDLLRYDLGIIEDPELKYFDEEFKNYHSKFAHYNAHSKYHIIIPLLMYLLQNHATKKSAYETSLNFMKTSRKYLREGDFAKLKTGSQRFITNTRFAADELRKYGLLRSDKKTFFKIWELSYFGLILACNIYADKYKIITDEAINKKTDYAAEKFTLDIIKKYYKKADSIDNFKKMIEYIEEEGKIITYGLNRMEEYFEKFNRLITAVVEDGKLNFKKTTTQDFISFMKEYNLDENFSVFADGLQLRKEIEVNLKDVYEILRSNKD